MSSDPGTLRNAHTNDSAEDRIPKALKGIDFALYAALQALGLPVKVAPVIKFRDGYGGISPTELRANKGLEVSMSDEEPIRNHYCQPHVRSNTSVEFESRLNQLKAARRVRGDRRDVTVGTSFKKITCLDDQDEYTDFDRILDDKWPHMSLPIVTWLNEAIEGNNEIQIVHLAYGDEVSLKYWYSAAAIFAVVPNYADRDILQLPDKIDSAKWKRYDRAFEEQ